MWTISKFCKIIFLIFFNNTCSGFIAFTLKLVFPIATTPLNAICTPGGGHYPRDRRSDETRMAWYVKPLVKCFCTLFFFFFYSSSSLHSRLFGQCHQKPTVSFIHLRHYILESVYVLENAYYCYRFIDCIVYCYELVNAVFSPQNAGRHHCARCVFM